MPPPTTTTALSPNLIPRNRRAAFLLGSVTTIFALYFVAFPLTQRRWNSKTKNLKESVSLSKKQRLAEFCDRCPKVELHAHLHGSIRESTLIELLEAKGIALPEALVDHHRSDDSTNNRSCQAAVGGGGGGILGLAFAGLRRSIHRLWSRIDDDKDKQSSSSSVQKMLPQSPKGKKKNRDLNACFQIFDAIHSAVSTTSSLRRVVREVLADFQAENVVYLELRSTPRELIIDDQDDNGGEEGRKCSVEDYINLVVEEFGFFESRNRELQAALFAASQQQQQQQQESASPSSPSSSSADPSPLYLIPRLLVSLDRSSVPSEHNSPPPSILHAIELFQAGNPYVVGVDLGGNPTKGNFKTFEPHLQRARDAGLRITVHCGEVPCSDTVEVEADRHNDEDAETRKHRTFLKSRAQEALDVVTFRPDRLGHCLYLPKEALKLLEADPIPIECCPSSNILTMSLTKDCAGGDDNDDEDEVAVAIPKHPRLRGWLNTGYPISINTDDSGVFSTTVSRELLLTAGGMDLGEWQVAGIVWASVDQVFEGNRRVRSQLARDVSVGIKRLVSSLGIQLKK
jgi:adenosine deaminase